MVLTLWICMGCVWILTRFSLEEQVPVKRQKRDKGIGGGLQTYTKYVCEKLEQEHEISNTDVVRFRFPSVCRLQICW